jgi:hypothetical protein
MKLIQKGAAAGTGQGFEDVVHDYATKWLHILFAEANRAS